MEVTRENFEEMLPLVEASIREADYIAFDCEFSGISTRLETEHSELDSPEDRYQKVKEVVEEFAAIQIGICPFTWHEESKEYRARPFNFYVYPISKDRLQSRDSIQKYQIGALSFLA